MVEERAGGQAQPPERGPVRQRKRPGQEDKRTDKRNASRYNLLVWIAKLSIKTNGRQAKRPINNFDRYDPSASQRLWETTLYHGFRENCSAQKAPRRV